MNIKSSRLYNKDLAPTSPEQRTWKTYNFAALWISMAHCIPTYMLASGLIGAGMSWGQALATNPSRQHHRARADPPEFARWDQSRHSVSGLRAGGVWHSRFKHSRTHAGAGAVRMVWNSGMDRRPSALCVRSNPLE